MCVTRLPREFAARSNGALNLLHIGWAFAIQYGIGFYFGIKDGIKRAGRNAKILVWQRIIVGFDPSPPQPGLRFCAIAFAG
jgi:hypothetical protein